MSLPDAAPCLAAAWSRRFVLCLVAVAAAVGTAGAQPIEPLPGTDPLTWQDEGADLAVRLMDGAHRYIDRKIAASRLERSRYWDRDTSSADAYVRSIEPNRRHLADLVGVVDDRHPAEMERFDSAGSPFAESRPQQASVRQVRWPVLDHVWGEGLLVIPRGEIAGAVILLPDADQSPESMLAGDGTEGVKAAALQLAEEGFEVVIPTLVGRETYFDDPGREGSRQTSREWVFRQAFYMGRHVIGYEVQKVLAAVDWFVQRHDDEARIGVAGYGEGGLISLYAAALDPRIDAALVSGYFDERQDLWKEPIYRQVWSLLRAFGDAEIASLVAPRSLVIEHAPVPETGDDKGSLSTPPFERVEAEVRRIRDLTGSALQPATLVAGPNGTTLGPFSPEAVGRFAGALGLSSGSSPKARSSTLQLPGADADARRRRQVEGLGRHVQMLVDRSNREQDDFFLHRVLPELDVMKGPWSTRRGHRTYSAEQFAEAARPYRSKYAELIGRFDGPMLPPNPRTRKLFERESYTAYDVVLDVREDLIAWGVLLIPNDLPAGSRLPVVVCQHGRNGLPRSTIDADSSYYGLGPMLVEQGFVTFSPHNLYRDEARYRCLDRKAKTVGATLFSFILDQHEQILNWLKTLPFVDGDRIALYGKSFGGLTALRVPPILEDYALSISSAYFNEETQKVANPNQPFSYMRTDEWEIPVWNLGNTFGHAQAAYLMVPRPFMVERGMWDLTALDRWVAYEYAQVRFLYGQLGIGDRTEIEFFQGAHAINADGTIRFLKKWLHPEEE